MKDLPLTLHNLHQVILKCHPKSGTAKPKQHFNSFNLRRNFEFLGPFGKAVELIDKMILNLKDKQNTVQKMPFLPVLSDILLHSTSQLEHVLEMAQDISYGITIEVCHPFLERLIKFCVNILCNEEIEVRKTDFHIQSKEMYFKKLMLMTFSFL